MRNEKNIPKARVDSFFLYAKATAMCKMAYVSPDSSGKGGAVLFAVPLALRCFFSFFAHLKPHAFYDTQSVISVSVLSMGSTCFDWKERWDYSHIRFSARWGLSSIQENREFL